MTSQETPDWIKKREEETRWRTRGLIRVAQAGGPLGLIRSVIFDAVEPMIQQAAAEAQPSEPVLPDSPAE